MKTVQAISRPVTGATWTLYTENKNLDTILRLTREYFQGFTTQTGIGYFKSFATGMLTREDALTITILTDKDTEPSARGWIKELAGRICTENDQETVLVRREPITEAFNVSSV
jgi:hypothetical protein